MGSYKKITAAAVVFIGFIIDCILGDPHYRFHPVRIMSRFISKGEKFAARMDDKAAGLIYEYTHGGNIYDENGLTSKDIIDFSANINPLGILDEVITAAIHSMEQSNIYPESNCRF